MNHRPKILTLGWEFPPLYAGGLGPACYGLTNALSKHADVTVILPRSDVSFKMDQVEIIGLNNWVKVNTNGRRQPRKVEMNRKKQVENDYRKPRKAEVNRLKEVFEMDFSAYPLQVSRKTPGRIFSSGGNEPGTPELFKNTLALTEEEKLQLFNEQDIYGPNILEKVTAYSDVVSEVVRNQKFDIIHAHDWVTFPAAVQLKQETQHPLVVHVHSLETDRVHTQSRNTVYEIERWGMRHADRVLPVSNFTKGNIVKYYGIEDEKIHPVYNGSEPVTLLHKRGKRIEKKVLFLGRITSQKGPEYLFETAVKLFKKDANVTFYVAGNGDQKEHLEWLVNSNGLSDRFVFTGFLKKEEVAKLLVQTDAYIMPSVSEPFGLSAVEAAQYNIPCIISKQSGVAEVLPNTLQADFWDTDKMANYLFAALEYKHLTDTLTENTRQNLVGINWDLSAMKVLKQYQHLLN